MLVLNNYIVLAGALLNMIGYVLVMESPGDEYVAASQPFWIFMDSLRSNKNPWLATIVFYITFALLIATFLFALYLFARQFRRVKNKMYKLKLNAKECISCEICMDVCSKSAIEMRFHRGSTIEGLRLLFQSCENILQQESSQSQMMTFPFMSHFELCDGCLICVEECPTSAVVIKGLTM